MHADPDSNLPLRRTRRADVNLPVPGAAAATPLRPPLTRQPEMMEYLGVPTDQVAYYAGLTSAVFSLCQGATGIAWGRAADAFGRKPVILIGLGTTMVTSILFGLSRTLWWAVLVRAVAGAGNGNVGTLRTMVAEMVPQKELQPRAFSIMPLIWTIGSILGPAFGGFFADPAAHHPDVFGKIAFFREYPYALPNLLAGSLFLVGIAAGVLFLRVSCLRMSMTALTTQETLASKKNDRDYGLVLGQKISSLFSRKPSPAESKRDHDAEAPLLGQPVADAPPPPPHAEALPSYRAVFSRQSSLNLLSYSILCLHSVAFDQLLPIFMHHPTQDHSPANPDVSLPLKFSGGFAINSARIGLLFTAYGVFGMVVQFLIFPPVARRFGVLLCLKACVAAMPVVYALTPFTVLLATPLAQQTAMFALMAAKSVTVVFAFPSVIILLTNSAASLRLLGTLNGVATSLSALGRAAGPAIGGGAFGYGVQVGYGILPWWILAGIAAAGAVPVWWTVETEGFGDDADASDSGDDDVDVDVDAEARSRAAATESAILDDDETDTAIASENQVDDRDRGRRISARGATLSAPLGGDACAPTKSGNSGAGGAGRRRLSSNLGQSNNGYGTGGTSF